MGTSTNYGGSPNWGATKSETTRVAGEGHTTPQKAASIIANVVNQMTQAPSLGFGQALSGGGSTGSASPATGGRHGTGSGGGGGARAAKSTGRTSARTVARGIGSFLSDVKQKGFKEALSERGLSDIAGLAPEEVALALADLLGGSASLIDETALRGALMDLVMEWCDPELPESLADRISAASDNIEEVLQNFFGNYIFEVFNTVGVQGVIKTHGPDKAEAMTGQIRDFIDSKLTNFQYDRNLTSVDWTGTEGAGIINDIVDHTITVFGSESP